MYHIFKFALVDRKSEFLKRFFISLYLLNSVLRGIVTLAMLRPYRSALRHMVYRLRGIQGSLISHTQAPEDSTTIRYRSTIAKPAANRADTNDTEEDVQTTLMSVIKNPHAIDSPSGEQYSEEL